jgi:tetratricopeptide (TPR) repeat protein
VNSNRMKVFLSAVTSEFAGCRNALSSDLRAIGCEVRVQEDFQLGPRTLLESLERYVNDCDRVIAIVGNAYGVDAAGVSATAATEPRSYTQWEYYFSLGNRLDGSVVARKDLYLYFASDDYLMQHPVTQSVELAERQRAFCGRLKSSGEHWGQFDNLDHLCRLVLRDGWEMKRRPSKPQNLPYVSIRDLFKGRASVLEELNRSSNGRISEVPGRQTATQPRRNVICGLGGVGKTRLAVEYAWRFFDDYSAALFLTAESPEAFRAGLAALAGPQILDIKEVNTCQDEEIEVSAVLRWLNENPGWLLIVDNADTQDAALSVEVTLAKLNGGHVLITSRISTWGATIESVELELLDEDSARVFLLDRTRQRRRQMPNDDVVATTLVKSLDGLALALEQAGAFIEYHRCSLDEYRDRWERHERRVTGWFDKRLMKYPRSLAITWETTVKQLPPDAVALLQVTSWLSSDWIPFELFTNSHANLILQERQSVADGGHAPEATPVNGEYVFDAALAALADYSMAKLNGSGDAFRVHRLVEEATIDRIPKEQQRAWLEATLAIVSGYLPAEAQDVLTWPKWNPLRPHVRNLVEHAEQFNIASPTARLLNGLCTLLTWKAEFERAEDYCRRALRIRELALGAETWEVGESLNNLALIVHRKGQYQEAEALLLRAIAIFERIGGSDNRNIIDPLVNMADLLVNLGRVGEAEAISRRALALAEQPAATPIYEDKLATSLNWLAIVLIRQDHPAEAEGLLLRALQLREKIYGRNHPDYAVTLNDLGIVATKMGQEDHAEDLLRQALQIDETIYGTYHPSVLRDTGNVAYFLINVGRGREAEPLLRKAVDISEKVYGEFGVETLSRLQALSTCLCDNGATEDAEAVDRRILLAQERILGGETPALAVALNNFAVSLRKRGKLTEAEPVARRALAIDEKALGDNNPIVPHRLNNLCILLVMLGKLDEAKGLLSRAWRLKADKHDLTSARMMFVSITIALLESLDTKPFVAQLKVLLGQKWPPDQANVAKVWDMLHFIERLRPDLPADAPAFLTALVTALNDSNSVSNLEAFERWTVPTAKPVSGELLFRP